MSVERSMNNQNSLLQAEGAAPTALPFGPLLKAGREAAGVELAVLAAMLKVPLKKIEALESGDVQQLPDMVFARALASSVCRHFGLDAAVVLVSLPQASHPAFRSPERVDTYRTGAGMALSLSDAHGIRWGLVGAIVCLVLALAVKFWPTSELATVGVSASIESEKRVDASPPQIPVPAVAPPQPGAETVAGVGPASTVESYSVASAPASAPHLSSSVGTGSATAPAPLPAPSSAPTMPSVVPSATGAATLQFTATTASWIRVTDTTGAVIWEKTVVPGALETVPGKAPLIVVIGRADVTRVMLNGQHYDLTSATRDNVARFEVRK
jgi:cytoskeleton protein RodZ